MQEFSYRCSTDGTELDTSSLEAPTQNSITEREGGSFKVMFHKTSLNYGETHNMDEIVELLDSCVMMKNRLLNKDGFSAMHRVFGYTPVIPGDLFGNSSGNIVEASAMEMGDDVLHKQARMKQACRSSFLFSRMCRSYSESSQFGATSTGYLFRWTAGVFLVSECSWKSSTSQLSIT